MCTYILRRHHEEGRKGGKKLTRIDFVSLNYDTLYLRNSTLQKNYSLKKLLVQIKSIGSMQSELTGHNFCQYIMSVVHI